MKQFDLEGLGEPPVVSGQKGPPNRMNDLPYREWMKFQKSFFRHDSDQALAQDCIEFFTKARWPDGTPSRCLVLDCEGFDKQGIADPRHVETVTGLASIEEIAGELERRASAGDQFDFVFLDLRRHIRSDSQLAEFLNGADDRVFGLIRRILVPNRYCCVLSEPGGPGSSGTPFPWSVALASRDHLRLRDEKIGIVQDEGRLYYCLFMQAQDDVRPKHILRADQIRQSTPMRSIPAWIIPKPPPRSKREVLHPAKFPETLIEEFIELFSHPGEVVFDPMIGTGSTVIAAMRKKRHGVGLDLSAQFASIAEERILRESARGLDLFGSERVTGKILVGDALHLDEVRELEDATFAYAVTSPPYWSMLQNPGSENQAARRERLLPLVYSDQKVDIGNIVDYDEFLCSLEQIYSHVANKLRPGGVLTIIVKNVKRDHVVYPLAWDLVAKLCSAGGRYAYLGTTFWCQDDVGLKPFAVGIHWVSNVLHQYCLHLQRR